MEPFQIGRYQVTAEIGRGGMATVYRAYDTVFEREVAIKVLPSEFLHDPTFRARFTREAKIIAALEHVAIVPVYDFGDEDGQPYLVMRLMTGGSLADRIHLSPIPLAEAARILEHIAPALDEAHAKGVIHRDLKPDNILFDQHGDPFLADFGIARLVAGPTLTSQYATMGTPAYMSPEQGRGDSDVDGRSDQYALGAILFEMLSGRVPYESDTPTGQIIKHITDPIPNILELCADCPPDCQAVIDRVMAKKREERFPNVVEMAQALMAVSQGHPLTFTRTKPVLFQPTEVVIPLPQASEPPSPPRFWKRLPLVVWLGLAAFILLCLLAVLGWVVYPAVAPKSKPTPSNTPTLSPTASLTATQRPTPTEEVIATSLPPTFTPVPIPRATPTLTMTSVETDTATPPPVAVVKVDTAHVRIGPGIIFSAFATYNQGTQLQVVGRNRDGTWLVIQLPGQAQTGWIARSTVDIAFDAMSLPEVVAPPVPTSKPAPTNTRDRAKPKPAKTTSVYP